MTSKKLILALLASVVTITVNSAVPGAAVPQAPVVVGIIVEGLDNDYLDLLRDNFGNGGFRRLAREGLVIRNADYGTNVDATAAAAMVMTGASPSVSGIPAEKVYDRVGLRPHNVFASPGTLGNYTSHGYTPSAMRVSTLSDEARIAGGGLSVAYAVAPKAAEALVLGGHAANCAVWLDPKTGNWASTTFYKDMPTSVVTRNRLAPLAMRLDTMSWAPSVDLKTLPALPDHLKTYPFRYVFPRSANADRYDMFMSSPMMNAEVTDIALDLVERLNIGRHQGVTDVLNLKYTLLPYQYGKNPDSRPELMDAYIRLDRNLEALFNLLDRTAGPGNSVVYLAGTPPAGIARRDDEQWQIPHGEFSTRKALSLLNMYLIALHGNGNYVTGYHDGAFYLNHDLIKERDLPEASLRREAAEFLLKMTGVKNAYALDDILAGQAGENAGALRRNTDVATAGDIYMEVAPGYELLDDHQTPVPSDHIPMSRRAVATMAPVFIMAPDVDASLSSLKTFC